MFGRRVLLRAGVPLSRALSKRSRQAVDSAGIAAFVALVEKARVHADHATTVPTGGGGIPLPSAPPSPASPPVSAGVDNLLHALQTLQGACGPHSPLLGSAVHVVSGLRLPVAATPPSGTVMLPSPSSHLGALFSLCLLVSCLLACMPRTHG